MGIRCWVAVVRFIVVMVGLQWVVSDLDCFAAVRLVFWP